MKKNISGHVIRRLPRYLRKLDELEAAGVTRISSFKLGELMGLTSSQIRQDFSCFGEFGQQGYGYNLPHLRTQIAKILGMDRGYRAVLVGAGNIGRALIDKFRFNDWGFQLLFAFDTDPHVIGTRQNEISILDAALLEQYLADHPVDTAVLAVPGQAAREMAERLIACGIEAIWNFTNVDIVDPFSSVIVENVHFSDSLLALCYYLTERQECRRPGTLLMEGR